jgi:hypothetical protein
LKSWRIWLYTLSDVGNNTPYKKRALCSVVYLAFDKPFWFIVQASALSDGEATEIDDQPRFEMIELERYAGMVSISTTQVRLRGLFG